VIEMRRRDAGENARKTFATASASFAESEPERTGWKSGSDSV